MQTIAVSELQLHTEAGRVPKMRPAEYADFLADVRERGVRVAIELQPGTMTILDGRCRWTAAKEAGLREVPVIDAPINGDDPVVYMLRAASKRRQLTDDQRAMMAEEEREWLAKKGKKNRKQAQREGGKKGGRGKKKTLETDASSKVSTPRAREEAARSHNVSERKVRQAQKVKRHNKKLAEKVKDGEVPLAQAVREVQREEKRKDLEAKAAAAPEPTEKTWELINDDCTHALDNIETGTIRLIFADPPYNIGIDYGQGTKADLLPDDKYLDWCRIWMSKCTEKLTKDGSFWVLIGDEYAAEFGVILKREMKLTIQAWIKWYETFGVNCPNNFNRCSRHLFYCAKDPKRRVFNAEAVNRPSDRQTKYGDSRADPGGKIWDDVWTVPRLVGTAKERIPDFPTQLPEALLKPIIGCASDPGDYVLDPFSGSATTGVVAVKAGRRFVGIEKSKQFADLATKRLRSLGNG